jgi:hypothetical protein
MNSCKIISGEMLDVPIVDAILVDKKIETYKSVDESLSIPISSKNQSDLVDFSSINDELTEDSKKFKLEKKREKKEKKNRTKREIKKTKRKT